MSLASDNPRTLRLQLGQTPFAELRIDRCRLGASDVAALVSEFPNVVLTYRGDADDRVEAMWAGIDAGALWIDVDIADAPEFAGPVIERAREHGTGVVASHHDFDFTPERVDLAAICERCFTLGDVAKIACLPHNHRDVARLLGLLDDERPVIPVPMGAQWSWGRAASLAAGAPWMYVAPDDGDATAPGQLTASRFQRMLDDWDLA